MACDAENETWRLALGTQYAEEKNVEPMDQNGTGEREIETNMIMSVISVP